MPISSRQKSFLNNFDERIISKFYYFSGRFASLYILVFLQSRMLKILFILKQFLIALGYTFPFTLSGFLFQKYFCVPISSFSSQEILVLDSELNIIYFHF